MLAVEALFEIIQVMPLRPSDARGMRGSQQHSFLMMASLVNESHDAGVVENACSISWIEHFDHMQ